MFGMLKYECNDYVIEKMHVIVVYLTIIKAGDEMMKNMYDVMQLLKKYHIFIYTGNRLADLDLMEMELLELKSANILPEQEYYTAVLIIRRERRSLCNK